MDMPLHRAVAPLLAHSRFYRLAIPFKPFHKPQQFGAAARSDPLYPRLKKPFLPSMQHLAKLLNLLIERIKLAMRRLYLLEGFVLLFAERVPIAQIQPTGFVGCTNRLGRFLSSDAPASLLVRIRRKQLLQIVCY